jgi:hypothetical protein
MTLGNMRENGVRRLDVSCWICHHAAVHDDVPVPWFGPRMVCTGCGSPNWIDRPRPEVAPSRACISCILI